MEYDEIEQLFSRNLRKKSTRELAKFYAHCYDATSLDGKLTHSKIRDKLNRLTFMRNSVCDEIYQRKSSTYDILKIDREMAYKIITSVNDAYRNAVLHLLDRDRFPVSTYYLSAVGKVTFKTPDQGRSFSKHIITGFGGIDIPECSDKVQIESYNAVLFDDKVVFCKYQHQLPTFRDNATGDDFVPFNGLSADAVIPKCIVGKATAGDSIRYREIIPISPSSVANYVDSSETVVTYVIDWDLIVVDDHEIRR